MTGRYYSIGRFYYIIGQLLHYRAFLLHYRAVITVSGVYYIIGWYNISKKRHPSKFTYSLHNIDLKTTDTAKYLGIIISQDMKWTKHITQTCSRANRALGFIKRNVKIRSPRIKEKLYNSLVRPHVEYACAVWSPHPPTRDGPTSRSTMDTKPPPQHQQR